MNTIPLQYLSLVSFILPPSILDRFELAGTGEEPVTPGADGLFAAVLHIHLDGQDNRPPELKEALRPNGFTGPAQINDFPVRDRKVALHVRRRRRLDSQGKNVLVNTCPLTADGTRYPEEFAAFLKETPGYIPGDGPFSGAAMDD